MFEIVLDSYDTNSVAAMENFFGEAMEAVTIPDGVKAFFTKAKEAIRRIISTIRVKVMVLLEGAVKKFGGQFQINGNLFNAYKAYVVEAQKAISGVEARAKAALANNKKATVSDLKSQARPSAQLHNNQASIDALYNKFAELKKNHEGPKALVNVSAFRDSYNIYRKTNDSLAAIEKSLDAVISGTDVQSVTLSLVKQSVSESISISSKMISSTVYVIGAATPGKAAA